MHSDYFECREISFVSADCSCLESSPVNWPGLFNATRQKDGKNGSQWCSAKNHNLAPRRHFRQVISAIFVEKTMLAVALADRCFALPWRIVCRDPGCGEGRKAGASEAFVGYQPLGHTVRRTATMVSQCRHSFSQIVRIAKLLRAIMRQAVPWLHFGSIQIIQQDVFGYNTHNTDTLLCAFCGLYRQFWYIANLEDPEWDGKLSEDVDSQLPRRQNRRCGQSTATKAFWKFHFPRRNFPPWCRSHSQPGFDMKPSI